MNQGQRRFLDHTPASSQSRLGQRYYEGLVPADMNNDGFTDAVAMYYTKKYGSEPGFAWGTSFFLNDGTGGFRVVDGADVLPTVSPSPSQRATPRGTGLFVPTLVRPDRTEGVILQPLNDALNVYKIVANSALLPSR